MSFDSRPQNADYCSPKSTKRNNHDSSFHARNTYGFIGSRRWCYLATSFDSVSRQSLHQTIKAQSQKGNALVVITLIHPVQANRRLDRNRNIIEEHSPMNRSAECLMDAGCLKDYSPDEETNVGFVRRFSQTIGLWLERSKQRRELYKLACDRKLLDDVGLSMYEIQREARKHFWKE